MDVPLDYEDWRGASSDEVEQKLNVYLEEDRQRGFVMERAPLFRLALRQTGERSYQFIWTYHHILLDGWSNVLVLKEVMASYEALAEGKELKLKAARPYRDYINWLSQQSRENAEGYWRQRLAGFREATGLAGERGVVRRNKAGKQQEHRRWLTAEQTARLRQFARKHQLTLNTLLQGAWAVALSGYSGEQDVVFGSTVAGRPPELAGVESMVGVFINTLPVRVKLEPGQRLMEWLKQLQDEQAQAQQYSYTPLVELQSWSEVERGSPLFESVVVFENFATEAFESSYGVQGEKEKSATEMRIIPGEMRARANYGQMLVVGPGDKLSLRLTTDAERYSGAAMERLLGQLEYLLVQMGSQSESATVGNLSLLSPQERKQVVEEWNRTEREYEKNCFQELFEEQARRNPEKIAVVYEGTQLSYRELNERSNQLAHYLRRQGVGPEVCVGLYLERSLELMVGLLGILKAGGAYVPLDPSYPPERIAFMAEESRLAFILADHAANLPDTLSRVVPISLVQWAWANESKANLSLCVRPDNLAYILYTSGSTGKPKGVMIEHRQIVNYFHALLLRDRRSPEWNYAMVQPLTFDSSQTVIVLSFAPGEHFTCSRERCRLVSVGLD